MSHPRVSCLLTASDKVINTNVKQGTEGAEDGLAKKDGEDSSTVRSKLSASVPGGQDLIEVVSLSLWVLPSDLETRQPGERKA